MSFREKQTSLTLAAILLVYGIYFVLAWRGGPQHGFGPLTISILALSAILICSQAVLALHTRAAERTMRDEREARLETKAAAFGYFVLLSLVLLGSWAMLAAPGRVSVVDAGLAAVVIAEIGRYGAFLVLVRRAG